MCIFLEVLLTEMLPTLPLVKPLMNATVTSWRDMQTDRLLNETDVFSNMNEKQSESSYVGCTTEQLSGTSLF